jgi:hypothetical protein
MSIEELYDIPLFKKKMGLSLKEPRIYNINHKLTLQNPYSLLIRGEKVTMSLEKWIQVAPELIWAVLYKDSSAPVPEDVEIIRNLSLAHDSYLTLKATIKELQPALIKELEQKKKPRRLKQVFRKLQN